MSVFSLSSDYMRAQGIEPHTVGSEARAGFTGPSAPFTPMIREDVESGTVTYLYDIGVVTEQRTVPLKVPFTTFYRGWLTRRRPNA